MKKSFIKFLVFAMVACVCVSGISVCAQSNTRNGEQTIVEPTPDPELPPEYVEIAGTSVGLKHLGGGSMQCTGSTTVYDGYKASVNVELQKYYSGDWHTIASWYDYDDDSAMAGDTYGVSSGYSYRVKATHKSYTSGGTWIETAYTYSHVIWY